MASIEVPLQATLEFAENVFKSPKINNGLIRKDSAGNTYTTQRPAIHLKIDASETISDKRGRGIYYWETTDALYFVNDDTLYKDNYATTVGTLSSGKEPLYIDEIGDYLVLIDRENNEGWTLSSGGTFAQISDVDFPSSLAGGGAVLDSILFIMDTDGVIYASGINDPTSWDALDVLSAEREPDQGMFLTKQGEHIVAFGTRTIEFFYNAANPTGSVLNRREDLSYSTGAGFPYGWWEDGDNIYFVASEVGNVLTVQRLSNLQLAPITSPNLNAALGFAVNDTDSEVIMAGANIAGHRLLFLNIYISQDGDYNQSGGVVFDQYSETWGTWSSNLLDIGNFPFIAWSNKTAIATGNTTSMLTNGDILEIKSTVPVDYTSSGGEYIAASYLEAQNDYIDNTSLEVEEPVVTTVTTPLGNVSTQNFKYVRKLALEGSREPTSSSDSSEEDVSVYVSYSNSYYQDYSTERPLSLVFDRKLAQQGRFKRRSYKVEYRGRSLVRLYNLHLDVEQSTYA